MSEAKDIIALPEDGTEADLTMKQALYRRAVGYDVEEVTVVTGGKVGDQEIRKTKHVPGDVKAMEQYRKLYGDGI